MSEQLHRTYHISEKYNNVNCIQTQKFDVHDNIKLEKNEYSKKPKRNYYHEKKIKNEELTKENNHLKETNEKLIEQNLTILRNGKKLEKKFNIQYEKNSVLNLKLNKIKEISLKEEECYKELIELNKLENEIHKKIKLYSEEKNNLLK